MGDSAKLAPLLQKFKSDASVVNNYQVSAKYELFIVKICLLRIALNCFVLYICCTCVISMTESTAPASLAVVDVMDGL